MATASLARLTPAHILRTGVPALAPIQRSAVRTFAVAAPTQQPRAEFPKAAHGFDLVREEFVPEYDSMVGIYRCKELKGKGWGCLAVERFKVGQRAVQSRAVRSRLCAQTSRYVRVCSLHLSMDGRAPFLCTR